MLPLRVRMDLGAVAIKGYPVFPKAPALRKPHHQLFDVITGHSFEESYPSTQMQSMYSAAPAYWIISYF